MKDHDASLLGTLRPCPVLVDFCHYVCICIHMYTCMYVCMYVYVCIHMYTCMYVCMYVYVCIHMYTCMYVCMYAYVCIHMHTCMYVCIQSTVAQFTVSLLRRTWYACTAAVQLAHIAVGYARSSVVVHCVSLVTQVQIGRNGIPCH